MASTGKVSLNGKTYAVRNVKEYQLDPLSDAFRTRGEQRRSDNRKVNKYPLTEWTKGIGIKRMHRETDYNINGIYDSTANTLHHYSLTPGILHEVQTHAAPLDHVVRYVNFKSDLWALFESDYKAGDIEGLQVAKFSGATDSWSDPYMPTLNAVTTASGVTSTLTSSHTTQSTYGNTLMVVVIASESGSSPPSGVTEAGNALAMLANNNDTARDISIWWRAAPTAGTQNVVASGLSGESAMAVYDLFHCPQTTPFRTRDAKYGSANNVSIAPVSVYGDFVVGGAAWDGGGPTTPGAGQTEDFDVAVYDLAACMSHERGADGASTTAHSYSWDGTKAYVSVAAAIKGSGVLSYTEADAEGIRGFDLTTHKAKMYAIGSSGVEELKYEVWSSDDGLEWATATGTGWSGGTLMTTTTTRSNQFDSDGARLCDFGNTLLAAIYDEANQEIEIYYTVDNGANWTTGAVVTSGYGPKSFIVGPNPITLNTSAPLLFTAEGVYRIDSAGTTEDLLLEFDGAPANGRWAAYGMDGSLWSPTDSYSYLHYELTGTSGREVGFVHPKEALPAARYGFGNMFTAPTAPYMIVAHGGGLAGQRASIFAVDYTSYEDSEVGRTWPLHSLYYEDDANVVLHAIGYSAEDDATPRLHFGLVGATSDELYHLEHPFTDPASGQTMKFQASSYLEVSEDDIGDPHADSALMNVRIDADNLSTTDAGEFVAFEYGIDGAEWNDNAEGEATFVGNFVSGDKLLHFGVVHQNETGETESGSETGISAKTLRSRIVLHRDAGDNTQFVSIKEFQLEARNRVAVLKGWSFDIDLADCLAVEKTFNTTEEVITALNAIQDKVVLMPFYIGESAEYLVEMASGTWKLDLPEDGGGDGEQLGIRTGTATITVEEVH